MTELEAFKFLESADGDAIWLESRRLDACLRERRRLGLTRVAITPPNGFCGCDLEFLRSESDIDGVTLLHVEGVDLSALRYLVELKYLVVNGSSGPLDFGLFPKLRELRINWQRGVRLDDACGSLERLSIVGYPAPTADLRAFPSFAKLSELELLESPIQTLNGISRVAGLRKLSLRLMPKLEWIADVVNLRGLEVLDCFDCRRLADHAAVGAMLALRVLRYNKCGRMPTIAFIEQMRRLEEFRFVGTNVLDGDLRPCLRLKRVGFSDMRHYSHRLREVLERIGRAELLD